MSNNVVGNVYQQVIEDVINASRVDFEEGGVEDGVLEELKRGWQQKLSQLEVASFPWDPKPEPPQPAQAAQAQQQVPQAAPQQQQQQLQQQQQQHHQQQQQQQHQYQQQQLPVQHAQGQYAPAQATMSPQPNAVGISLPTGGAVDPNVKGEPYIKQEPGSQSSVPNMHAGGGLAQARAMQHISARYGNDASSAINAGAQQPPGQPPLPQMQQNQARPGQPPQQQQQQPQQQYPLPGQQQAGGPPLPGFKNSQTDGAGDEGDDYDEVQGVLMQRDKAGTLHELGRVEIDGLLHQQFLARAKAMEGGGLMLPLQEATKTPTASAPKKKGKGRSGVAQYDGEDDEDGPVIPDEDAINSDLDDSDDERDEDEVDDEGLGHIMLCMYDKVQRVKNKWKCVLKDGVLTVNGKEYVFHKATGEYEW